MMISDVCMRSESNERKRLRPTEGSSCFCSCRIVDSNDWSLWNCEGEIVGVGVAPSTVSVTGRRMEVRVRSGEVPSV